MDETQLRTRAETWFAEHASEAGHDDDFDVSVFHDMGMDEERGVLTALQAWHQNKWGAGLAGLDWPAEFGGHDLGRAAAELVDDIERGFPTPLHHELFDVTIHLVAPTVRIFGTPEQVDRFVASFARAEELCVQLFSEPGAGSDLAGLATRARRDGDDWVVNGQKVWSSGAQFADHGLLLARTDDGAVKQAGITAFLVPMDADGVTVRPLRQMSGGSSFCEVFLDDVRIPDELRLGDEGQGWKVGTTTLSFERDMSGGDTHTGGSWDDLRRLAEDVGRVDDPAIRPSLADAYIDHRLAQVATELDLLARHEGLPQGPEGSVRKLQWVGRMHRISHVAAELLGSRLAADTGAPRTFGWGSHVLGAPGYRIAGGTDEIQRTIIAERLLGLPAGPKLDRGRPWNEIPR